MWNELKLMTTHMILVTARNKKKPFSCLSRREIDLAKQCTIESILKLKAATVIISIIADIIMIPFWLSFPRILLL
jgi:hypothetical protein|tara:strand:- start:357 stop:581 length:225 start_codon:yes stop_codon:yes gene_type:complete